MTKLQEYCFTGNYTKCETSIENRDFVALLQQQFYNADADVSGAAAANFHGISTFSKQFVH